MEYTREKLKRMFREYWNDYLTIQNYAEAYGVTRDFMFRIINIGRKLHNKEAEKKYSISIIQELEQAIQKAEDNL